MERGEKTDLLLNRSEELMETSYAYKDTATKVKKTMCCRKYKMMIAAIVALIVLALFLWLILR